MKENFHNQSQGREVIAEGGAGDDVGKNNEKSTGMITDCLKEGKEECIPGCSGTA